MGIFLSRHNNIIISLRTKVVFAAILLASVVGATIYAPNTFAADAEYTTGEKTTILYQGELYNGPNTNKEDLGTPTGWMPSNKNGDVYGTTYYIKYGNGDIVIWIEKGSNKAHWSEIDKPSGQPRQYWKLKNTKDITISVNRDIAQRDAMKSVFKKSITDYSNNVCTKKPFAGNSNAQRECRETVSAKFDSCWTTWTNPDDFTIGDVDRPADGMPVDDIASCMTETEIGKVAGYRQALEAARDEANTQGSDAYNEAVADDAPEEDDTGATCRIDGIGWILCPVITITAGIVDGAYGMVSLLLSVQPITTSGDTKPIYEAWTIMRNFANITFVIAFLIIVFSQLTNIGISNYGVKKLIPRLIMAAIFVNISFWVCAIAVDISNVLGTSLKTLFDGIGGTLDSPRGGVFTGEDPWANAAGYVVAGLVGGGIVLYTTLAALLPALVTVLFAIVAVFLVLTLRQALIILLIVISPLAFVAMLLPNTQGWFTKWRQLLQTLLLMFPIIAVIFGASAFASEIVMKAAGSNVALQIMGAAVSIIPLAITPVVMKTAGGLLNRFGGIVNNPNKGPFDKLRRGAESIKEGRQARARGLRLTGQGGNSISRGTRRAFAVPSRIRNNLAARRDRNMALNEAADAGYNLQNAAANEAAQIRMATASANSAKSATSLQNLSPDTQANYLGMNSGENRSLDAAIRSQISQGERQAVSEIEAQIAPESANQLGSILEDAIRSGDRLSAQAAQNRLSNMGNKGADIIASVIDRREKAGGNVEWDGMRTELARNMSGGVMDKNEALKNWAVRTEIDKDGKLVKEIPKLDSQGKVMLDDNGEVITERVPLGQGESTLEGYMNDLIKGGKGNELSADKFKKQTPSIQKALLNSPNNPVSKQTLQTALNPNNISAFDPEIIKLMEAKLQQNTTSQAAPGSNREKAERILREAAKGTSGTQPIAVDSNGSAELKINHSEAPTRPIPTTTPSTSAKQAQNASPSQPFGPGWVEVQGTAKPTASAKPAPAASPEIIVPVNTNTPTGNQTINYTLNQTVNDNRTNNISQPSSPATGRRSSGAPLDQPGSSTAKGFSGRRSAAPTPKPQQEPTSSFLPPNPGPSPSDMPDWFNK